MPDYPPLGDYVRIDPTHPSHDDIVAERLAESTDDWPYGVVTELRLGSDLPVIVDIGDRWLYAVPANACDALSRHPDTH